MTKMILTLLMVLAPLTSFSETVTPARIAELTAHRIDRLVTLKKIDVSFNTRTELIEVMPAGPAPIAYRALVSQTKSLLGEPLQVEIFFNAEAKAISFNIIPGGVVGKDPQWTDQDAVSLLEHSLHEVLENAMDAEISPFYTDLTAIRLTKTVLNGADVAKVEVSSSATPNKLNIYFKLDGTYISTEILP